MTRTGASPFLITSLPAIPYIGLADQVGNSDFALKLLPNRAMHLARNELSAQMV